MTDSLLQHLTPDEVELWAQGLLPATRDAHLAQCAERRTIAELERELIRELSQLTRFRPAFAFGERGAGRRTPRVRHHPRVTGARPGRAGPPPARTRRALGR